MSPWSAERSARPAAEARPFVRRISSALSMSPSASCSAFLQSIIPAPVRSRSSLTCFAVISAIASALVLDRFGGSLGLFGNDELGLGLDLGTGGARHDGLAALLPALGEGVGDQPGDQRDRADRVVVAGDHEVHLVGITVRIDDRDDRDAELTCLVDGDVLLLGVDHEDRVGEPLEALHAAEVALELLLLVAQPDRLPLGGEVEP